MTSNRTVLTAAFPAALLLAAASPAAAQGGADVHLTSAQQARLKLLTEGLGECHRARAVAQAGGKTSVDLIVDRVMVACRPQLATLRTEMVKIGGAPRADAALARQEPRWREAIRRIVAGARTGR